MRDPRRRPAAVVPWSVAAEAFLLASDYTLATCSTYRGYLKRAGERLGETALDRLTAEDLAAYRAEVLAARGFRASQVLMAVRLFLGWAAERGLLRLPPEAIRETLRPPSAQAGLPQLVRVPGRRRGYPAGSAGISLVVEEMRALREALRNANPGRWAGLLRGTTHPGQRRADGGAEELAPAAVLDADGGGRQRYKGPDAILTALGYAAGPAGERRLLEALARLRLAFAAQQQRTLGRTV